MLRKYQNSENIFEKIIEINRERKSSEIVIYNEFQNLIVHCLRTNLNKAILISKALLSESEKKNMPLNYQKTFLFDLGVLKLLIFLKKTY